MLPGTYYTEKLNTKLAAADRAKTVLEGALKAFNRGVLKPIIAKQLGIKLSELRWRNAYKGSEDLDCCYSLAPGQEVRVASEKLGGAVRQWIEAKKKARNAAKEACNKRCEIAEQLENRAIGRFNARPRGLRESEGLLPGTARYRLSRDHRPCAFLRRLGASQ